MRFVVSFGSVSANVDPVLTIAGERESGSKCDDLTTVGSLVMFSDVGCNGQKLEGPC